MRSFAARYWLDAVVVLFAILAQVEAWIDPALTPRPVTSAAALLWTLPLLLRRRYPFGAPAFVFAVLGLETLLPGDVVSHTDSNVFLLVLNFAIAGAHREERLAIAGGGVGYATIAAILLIDPPDTGSAVRVFLLCAAAWVVGRFVRQHELRAEESEQRAARLERDHETAVIAERARIASELHDVIAHSVSVMTVQAGAARMMLDEDPERARAPLTAVEETGRQALGEMRRLLGILRGSDEEEALTPQPGIAQLGALVEQVRAAGLPVDITAEGEPRKLAPGVDLTAYRVVQEALTNVLKHAGAARAHVRVRHGEEDVEIEVVNTGRVIDDPNGREGGGGGHGLIGMRQRVSLYGGELEAHPGEGGGYVVRARLPAETAPR